jgi:hypothetical protein
MCKFIENIGEKLRIHLEKNSQKIEIFASQFGENISDNLILPFLNILNLCELSPIEKINDILHFIISESKDIKEVNQLLKLRKNVLYRLIDYYPLFNKELISIKEYMKHSGLTQISIEKRIQYYELILNFLCQESNKKTKIVQDIYDRFYAYCEANRQTLLFENFTRLMRIITCAHRDYQCAVGPNLVHAVFQVTFVYVLLDPESPLGSLTNEFIDALDWFFQALSDYTLLEKTTDIKYIARLNKMCKTLDELCENTSDKNINEYKYLRRSLLTVCKEMIMNSVVKYITSLFEKNTNARWLEVVIYFPELFEESYNKLFDCIED